jgi:DNA-directed RNA polymerase specialized sigma24 family protein
MDRGIAVQRKREMQPEDFRRLLARLDPDPARASQAYEKLRRELVRFFCRNQQSLQAEELADAALDEVAKKPDSYPIKNVNEFAIGVARFVRLENLRRHSVASRVAEEQGTHSESKGLEQTILDGMDREQKMKCFLRCMETFKPEERCLILEYYPAESCDLEERRRQLAAALGVNANALTSRMNRLRAKLVKCCAGCYPAGTLDR